jgi:hypothetical protein
MFHILYMNDNFKTACFVIIFLQYADKHKNCPKIPRNLICFKALGIILIKLG